MTLPQILVIGVLLVLTTLLLWRIRLRLPERQRGQAERIEFEDVLKHLFKFESDRRSASIESVSGQLGVSRDRAASILSRMRAQGLIRPDPSALRLTDAGRDYAQHVIRAHRLWERFLADRTGMPELDWHGQAEVLEHRLTPEEADQLAAQLGHPTHDPHGDPVPPAAGAVPLLEGSSLAALQTGDTARILHVEDEPPSVYARVLAEGLYPGMELRVVESGPDGMLVHSEGRERLVDLQAAGNVTVRTVAAIDDAVYAEASRLSELPVGASGKVALVSRAARAVERRRFLDLGLLPGTVVKAEMAAPGGDPVAYRIRGALIALRKEQADHILVVPMKDAA